MYNNGSFKKRSSKYLDVVSIPASDTIDLIYRYEVHAHPMRKQYNYRPTNYLTFRKKYGLMEKLYSVENKLIINHDNINNLDDLKVSEDVRKRISGYIKERVNGFDFSDKGENYVFYVLNFEKELMHKPRRSGQGNQCYFTLKELESGKEIVNKIDFDKNGRPIVKDIEGESLIEKASFDKDEFTNDNSKLGDSKQGIAHLNEVYKNASIEKKERLVKIVERGLIAQKFKEYIGYKCQLCESLRLNPYSFKKKNGEYYVETHHVVAVNEGEKSSLAIENLICVCPNHHRQIHYGNVELIVNSDSYIEYMIDGENVIIKKIKLDI